MTIIWLLLVAMSTTGDTVPIILKPVQYATPQQCMQAGRTLDLDYLKSLMPEGHSLMGVKFSCYRIEVHAADDT